jgi:hypothetical protein
MFNNRKILIATKHQKENVIAPLLKKHFAMQCFVAEHFDTDSLGTFTGEIERREDPITTLRNKCLGALKGTSFDLVIASEGSFGPHPSNGFITAGDELILLLDKKNNLEILTRELTTKTNFNAKIVKSKNELIEFSELVGFPEHRLILRRASDCFSEIYKGIGELKELEDTFKLLMKKFGQVYVETDMRAMFNPTRMNSIEIAMQHLVLSMQSYCPNCETPGFSVRKSEIGLPCAWCNAPTKCIKCDFEELIPYPNKKKWEDPAYCDFCNP